MNPVVRSSTVGVNEGNEDRLGSARMPRKDVEPVIEIPLRNSVVSFPTNVEVGSPKRLDLNAEHIITSKTSSKDVVDEVVMDMVDEVMKPRTGTMKMKGKGKGTLTDAKVHEGLEKLFSKRIRLSMGQKPFDVVGFMRTVKMDALSFADLLWMSPALRKMVQHKLRHMPKEIKDQLMNLYGDEFRTLESPERHLYTVKKALELSRYNTHKVLGVVSGKSTFAMIDGGACVNCVGGKWVREMNLPIYPRTTNLTFTQVDGRPADISGEIHDTVFDMGGMTVPFSAMMVENMDGAILFGRPFLEKTNMHADYTKGRFFFQWQNRLAVAEVFSNTTPITCDMKYDVYEYMRRWDQIKEIRAKQEEVDDLTVSSQSSASMFEDNEEDNVLAASVDVQIDNEGHVLDPNNPYGFYGDHYNEEPSLRGMLLEMKDEISRDEFSQLIDQKEIDYASIMFPNTSSRSVNEDDEMIEIAKLLGVKIGDEPHDEGVEHEWTPEFWVDQKGFGIPLKYECGVISPTPLIKMTHPALEGRHLSVGDTDEVNEHKERIEELLVKFKERFLKDGDQLQQFTNVPPIHYRLRPDATKYPRAKVRKWSEKEAAVLMEYKTKNANYLESSQSPTSCLPLLVKKKDGSWRVVVNFIPVNRLVAPFAWPLGGMDASYRKLLWAKIFSFWDFASGYHQSPLREDSRWLTATSFPDGSLMQWTVGPQGFIDTGQWFTYHVHMICDDPLLKKYISHYVDDGHLGTTSFDEHVEVLERFFEKLEYHNATLSGKKSGFFVKVFRLLGMIITHDKIYSDESKLNQCKAFLEPSTPSELKGFIHFVGFYQMKIPEYSRLSRVLHQGLKKVRGDAKKFRELWAADTSLKEAYEALKKAMYSSKVLRRFDRTKIAIVATDASENTISYVLAHPEDDDITIVTTDIIYVPVLFGGKTMADAET
jgi:hypothetical protein